MRTAIFTVFLFIIMGLPQVSLAATVPNTACDTDVLDVHEARAWMEGAREIETAQLIILKPDSVLEYSCFNEQLDELGGSGPWSNNNGHGNMNSGLNWVRDARNTFINSNFNHPGGGTGSSYNCGAMSAIFDLWSDMKCKNADDVASFHTFQNLENNDYRTLPYSNSCNVPNRSNLWNAAIAAANPAPAGPPASGGIAQKDTFLTQLSNNVAGNPVACTTLTPIPTGVMVGTGAPYPDALCSIPSCYYDGTTNTCK